MWNVYILAVNFTTKSYKWNTSLDYWKLLRKFADEMNICSCTPHDIVYRLFN